MSHSYTTPEQTEALSAHILTRAADHWYRLHEPGTGNLEVDIIFAANCIVLTGDLCFGTPNGCISPRGYNLAWFAGHKSESYLCEKFLTPQIWQVEAAEETIHRWLGDPGDYCVDRKHLTALGTLIDGTHYWDHDVPNKHELYAFLADLDTDYVTEGVPGYDYPRKDAGWLCAVQSRFAELWSPPDDQA